MIKVERLKNALSLGFADMYLPVSLKYGVPLLISSLKFHEIQLLKNPFKFPDGQNGYVFS